MGRLVAVERCRRAVLFLVLSLATAGAQADVQIMLSPGPGYQIDWRPPGAPRIVQEPHVDRQQMSPVDRWFQIAPGGGALAMWTTSNGMAVFRSSGEELWRRKDAVRAFRFSPKGEQIAIASTKGIEVFALDKSEPRLVANIAEVDWLSWTDFGLLARTRSSLKIVADDGTQRTLAKLPARAVVAAGRRRVVYFSPGSLTELELATGANPALTKLADREPVINAEISPDGATILFATAKRVYLREGKEQVRSLADVVGVHSLLFSPDGSAYLWAANWGGLNRGGAVVDKGQTVALPPGVRSARFRHDGKAGLVLTSEDGVFTWDAATGARSVVGGISPDDGVNLAGDLASSAAVAFYYKKTVYQKKVEAPRAPHP